MAVEEVVRKVLVDELHDASCTPLTGAGRRAVEARGDEHGGHRHASVGEMEPAVMAGA
jgi:hypothetical protein